MSNTAIVSRRIRKLEPRDKEYLHRLPVMGLYVVMRPDGSKHPQIFLYGLPAWH